MSEIIKEELTAEEKIQKRKEYQKQYQKEYREKTKEKRRQHNLDKKDYYKEKNREYFQKNKEKLTYTRKRNYHLKKLRENHKDIIKDIVIPENLNDEIKIKLKKYLDIEF